MNELIINMKIEKFRLPSQNFYWIIIRTVFAKTWTTNLSILLIISFIITFGLSLKIQTNVMKYFQKVVMTIIFCYLFLIPMTFMVEEILHAYFVFKKKIPYEKAFLKIEYNFYKNFKIYIKKWSIEFEGAFNCLDYIHFLGAGCIGCLFFVLVLFPFLIFFLHLFNSKTPFILAYLSMLTIPVKSLFIGRGGDGAKAIKISKICMLTKKEAIIELIRGFLFLILIKNFSLNKIKKEVIQ